MTIPNRVTNADIYFLLGEIKGTTDELKRTINGNGKPGLVSDHQDLKVKVEAHLKKAESDDQKKEKLSARWWAVIMVAITAVIGNVASLIFLFIRTGAIK